MRQTLKTYYQLTKPGIVYGNALAAIAGYFFGAHGQPMPGSFFAMLVGISMVMASACVFNNVIDKDIDAKMSRTSKRAVPSGRIRTRNALIYAAVLLLLGSGVLWFGTNPLALIVAVIGHFAYVVLYGVAKRRTHHGTLVGTISGSTPPVIGYVAATGQVDAIAVLLFVVMAAWQMPHFFAIAIFRKADYEKAGIPVLSVVKGLDATRKQITAYVLLYTVSLIVFSLVARPSLLWILIMLAIALYWLYLCVDFQKPDNVTMWARRQFGWSLIVLLVFCTTLSLDSFLH